MAKVSKIKTRQFSPKQLIKLEKIRLTRKLSAPSIVLGKEPKCLFDFLSNKFDPCLESNSYIRNDVSSKTGELPYIKSCFAYD